MNRVEELRLLYRCILAVTRQDDPVALVGALRSGLFGVSDSQLYQFKRAGGEFNYASSIPPGMSDELTEIFGKAFEICSKSVIDDGLI